jgi:large subunit ribosomal protein L7/L12
MIPEENKQIKETEKLENSSTVDVILEEFSRLNKVSVLKAVLEVTGLGLKEGKELIEAAPSLIRAC